MPVQRGKDKVGTYFQFGDLGKKYYYTPGNTQSRTLAKNSAKAQGKAIKSNQQKR